MEPKLIKTRDKVLAYLKTKGPSTIGDIATGLTMHEVTILYHVQKLVQAREIQHTAFRKTKVKSAKIYSLGFDKNLPPTKHIMAKEVVLENIKAQREKKAEALQARTQRARGAMQERHKKEMARLLKISRAKAKRQKERLKNSIAHLLEKQKLDIIKFERRLEVEARAKATLARIQSELRDEIKLVKTGRLEEVQEQEEKLHLTARRREALENAKAMARKKNTPFGWLIENGEKDE